MNRLLFKPDEDEYVLGTRKALPPKVADERPFTPPSDKESENLLDNSDSANETPETSDYTKLVDLLKKHSANIIAKGNPSK